MLKSRSMVELTPELEAEIRARTKIRPDEPGTKPGDPGNGRVFVLNARVQIFNGQKYRRMPDGYYAATKKLDDKNKMEFLHVAVWQFHNGAKPDGYVIHHDRRGKDGNRDTACNDIEWLRLMTPAEHRLYHSRHNPSIELICKGCHKIFWGRSRNEKYCPDCAGGNKSAARNGTVVSLKEALAVESDSAEILRAESDDKRIRICFFCHRPFETDVDSMEVACGRSDCAGKAVAAAYEHAKNNALKDLVDHCGGVFEFFSKKFKRLIRCLFIDGKIYFVARDVAIALGYKNPLEAIRKHVKKDHKFWSEMLTPGGKQKVIVIDEAGFYRLSFSSKLPEAEAFTEWVTSVVLPALRKYGQFIITDETAPPMLLPEDTVLVRADATQI